MRIIFAVVSVGLLNGLGQVIMRVGGRHCTAGGLVGYRELAGHPLWLLGLGLSWCCGIAWAWLVTRVPLIIAIPVNVGVYFITIALASRLMLGEGLTPRQGVGFALVLMGIALVCSR